MALLRLLDRTGRFTGELNRLQLIALAHLIRAEDRQEQEKAKDEFEGRIFASNPDLYRALYIDGVDTTDEGFEQEVPQTEADIHRMMAELRELGVA